MNLITFSYKRAILFVILLTKIFLVQSIGQVVTRFPPEPNGYLHIGHAKSICMNFGLARDYKGQCNLRFDDTNPTKENIEYVNSIKRDVEWLGFNWDGEVKFSSSYFDKFYQYAEELISKGLAYVCFLSAEEIVYLEGLLKSLEKIVLIVNQVLKKIYLYLEK